MNDKRPSIERLRDAINAPEEIPEPPEGQKRECTNCCFQHEPFTKSYRCDKCILQPVEERDRCERCPHLPSAERQQLEAQRSLKWQPLWKKYHYFGVRG